jgi:hypothetical protein
MFLGIVEKDNQSVTLQDKFSTDQSGQKVAILLPPRDTLRVFELLRLLRVSRLLAVIGAILTLLAATAGAAYKLGHDVGIASSRRVDTVPPSVFPVPGRSRQGTGASGNEPTAAIGDGRTQSLQSMILSNRGPYVWQWAGENWDGRVTFTPAGAGIINAELSIDKIWKVFENGSGQFKTAKLVPRSTPGRVVIADDGRVFDVVGIQARFDAFDGKQDQVVTLSMKNLHPVTAFAGTVEYQTAGEQKIETGGVFLVGHEWMDW